MTKLEALEGVYTAHLKLGDDVSKENVEEMTEALEVARQLGATEEELMFALDGKISYEEVE